MLGIERASRVALGGSGTRKLKYSPQKQQILPNYELLLVTASLVLLSSAALLLYGPFSRHTCCGLAVAPPAGNPSTAYTAPRNLPRTFTAHWCC